MLCIENQIGSVLMGREGDGMRTESTTKTIATISEIFQNNQNNPDPKIAQICVVPILSEIALSLATIADGLGETSGTEGVSVDAFFRAIQVDTPTKQTNADRIRAMTDEELANFIGGIFTIERDVCGCYDPHTVITQKPRVEIRDFSDMIEWLKEKVPE